jgi:hypothetical protein
MRAWLARESLKLEGRLNTVRRKTTTLSGRRNEMLRKAEAEVRDERLASLRRRDSEIDWKKLASGGR